MPVNEIQSTTSYGKFKLLGPNRDVNQGHVDILKKAFEERGNLSQVQPILVNERMEVIDGQHRLTAAKQLRVPVYYTVGRGLTIDDARSMNIIHKVWRTDDYAKSYAESGKVEYQKYLELFNDYNTEELPLSHSVILAYALNGQPNGFWGEFRRGEFEFVNTMEETRILLDLLIETLAIVPQVGVDKTFCMALLRAMKVTGYDHDTMLAKLRRYGDREMRHFGTELDYLRALEDIYNHGKTNRFRLY
jgi:hypothetical protein